MYKNKRTLKEELQNKLQAYIDNLENKRNYAHLSWGYGIMALLYSDSLDRGKLKYLLKEDLDIEYSIDFEMLRIPEDPESMYPDLKDTYDGMLMALTSLIAEKIATCGGNERLSSMLMYLLTGGKEELTFDDLQNILELDEKIILETLEKDGGLDILKEISNTSIYEVDVENQISDIYDDIQRQMTEA